MTQQEALQVLKSGANVFLTGEPGAGKTYTINEFVEWCHEEGKDVAITASTGIAASHINGSTIHSWSGINTRKNLSQDKIENLKFDDRIMERVQADVLIIDEISMLGAPFIDDLNNVLICLRGENKPFGGIQIVFVGDFFQLPPVPDFGQKEVDFAFESVAWNLADLTVCYLTEQHRQSDAKFLEILSQMRAGNITEENKEILRGRTRVEPPQMHLYPLRMEVDAINNGKLAEISAPVRTYRMKSEGIPFLVERLKKQVLSPEILEVKVGAEVMFTRNDREHRFVNGSLGVVVGYDGEDGFPIVELRDGTQIVPEYASWSYEEHGNTKAEVRQLPLRLAWAITVHKSQGMTLDSASVDLTKCFEYGMGYVAISRVRSLEGLHLHGLNKRAFEIHPKVLEQDRVFRKLSTE